MTKVYSTSDWLQVATFKSILESYGIACEIKSDFPNAFRGKTSFHALYVFDDAKEQEAKDILSKSKSQTDDLAESSVLDMRFLPGSHRRPVRPMLELWRGPIRGKSKAVF